jgi:CheY-like chemotaxis protein
VSFLNKRYVADCQYDFPDLYLLDKRIPDIDGLEIGRRLRANTSSKDIPVIVVSASPKIQQQALNAGATDFLERPVQMNSLLKIVDRYKQKTLRITSSSGRRRRRGLVPSFSCRPKESRGLIFLYE